MRFLGYTAAICLVFLAAGEAAFCEPGRQNPDLPCQDIIQRLESRYKGTDIQAGFTQESTLEAMDITDTATGRVWFKYPGMMRWEYETPDAHAIITDGETLWIYRPEDKQVIVGDALAYFGNGKGASFLSNIELVKEEFKVEKLPEQKEGFYTLELIPREKTLDLAKILMHIDKKSLLVRHVVTENAYNDKTRISFEDIRFPDALSGERFHFDIPPGADVVQLDK